MFESKCYTRLLIPGCVCLILGGVTTAACSSALSQELPDAPFAASVSTATPFSSPYINAPAPIRPVCLDASGKLGVYVHRLMGPATMLGPAAEAAFIMALPPKNYPPEWRQGGAAYWRNYGASFGRQQTGEFSRMAVGIALHEDPRYYRSASTAILPRVLHAVGFTLIDRSDGGSLRPALANIIGAGAGGFVGNAFLPSKYTDLRHSGVRTGVQMSSFAASNVIDEFRPEIAKLKSMMSGDPHHS